MNNYEKLEWLVFAIQEAINGNNGELENALEVVETLREPYLKGKDYDKTNQSYCQSIGSS
jgi:hypothetical protein